MTTEETEAARRLMEAGAVGVMDVLAVALADDFPLTCTWCRNSPATHFLVYDYTGMSRQQVMLCGECGHRTHVLPDKITGYWLFRLAPDDPFECGEDDDDA